MVTVTMVSVTASLTVEALTAKIPGLQTVQCRGLMVCSFPGGGENTLLICLGLQTSLPWHGKAGTELCLCFVFV